VSFSGTLVNVEACDGVVGDDVAEVTVASERTDIVDARGKSIGTNIGAIHRPDTLVDIFADDESITSVAS
jgi:hypothetical protein